MEAIGSTKIENEKHQTTVEMKLKQVKVKAEATIVYSICVNGNWEDHSKTVQIPEESTRYLKESIEKQILKGDKKKNTKVNGKGQIRAAK